MDEALREGIQRIQSRYKVEGEVERLFDSILEDCIGINFKSFARALGLDGLKSPIDFIRTIYGTSS